MALAWPEDCLQAFLAPLWEETQGVALERGRLIWGFFPHVGQEPRRMVPEGRGENASEHSQGRYRIEALDLSKYKVPDELPLAGLVAPEGEEFFIYRAKKRPLLVVQDKTPEVPKELKSGGAHHQTTPTILVAPYYGKAQDGTRAGWHPRLVEPIRRCVYPQYFWDVLPFSKTREESVLRLDQISPVSRWLPSFTLTKWRLSQVGLQLLAELLEWNFSGRLDPNGSIYYLRDEFAKLPSIAT